MTPDAPTGERLRLLHWNIHSWVDPETNACNVGEVIDLIQEHHPDVVSLVEVDETWSEPSKLQQVAAVGGYTAVFVPSFEYGSDEPRGGFGNAILTRLPVIGVEARQLTWPTTVYQGREPTEVRLLLLVRLRLASGEEIAVGSTHWPASDHTARLLAAQRLMSLTARFDVPWIVCGDFNMEPTAWLQGNDELAIAPVQTVKTYPTSAPTVSIDYLVATPSLALRAEALSQAGSDHLPVLVSADL